MSKPKVGDKVLVTSDMVGERYLTAGTVVIVNPSSKSKYPFSVLFSDGVSVAFSEQEIEQVP